MKAWRSHGYGAEGNPADAIEKLKCEEVSVPVSGAGQIQVKVSHAAINPIDWKLFSGGLHGIVPCAHPYVPGFDIAGTVSAVGEGESSLLLPLFVARVYAPMSSSSMTTSRPSLPCDDVRSKP